LTTLDDWPRVKQVLEGAMAREGPDLEVYLTEACGGDTALRDEVERLLAVRDRADTFLEAPAARLLAEPGGQEGLIGRALNSYQPVSRLGAGAMGEVYLARDTKLNRDVALKVLPAVFAADAEQIARFRREAQLLASLNHPHIAAIYGLEEDGSTRALVLELVEGQTLADRIAQGPLPLDEALPIARQIAEAVEAAHEHGVVHRDLKPANIKLRPEGTVKVLDFGLAKALERGGAAPVSAALASPATPPAPRGPAETRSGMILGTPSYMSPEQARGRPVDKRSDIWAFGCVLYEMLTGRRLFGAKGSAEVLAQIVEGEPDLSALPASTPASIRRLLGRCLEKDRRKRLPDIGVARIEIDDALAAPAAGDSIATAATFRERALPAGIVAAALIVASTVGVLVYGRSSRAKSQPILRASIHLGEPLEFGVQQPSLAISPDGTRVVYRTVGGGPLRSRLLSEPGSTPIAGTEGAVNPVFSPDGKSLAFFVGPALKKVSFAGGAVATVATLPMNVGAHGYRGAAWADDGTIAFAPSTAAGLFGVPEGGGEARPLTTIDPNANERAHRWPHFVPGGRAVLFTVKSTNLQSFDDAQIVVRSLDTGAQHAVAQGDSAQYLPTGHLVVARAGALYAVRFDVARLAVTGAPVKVADDVTTHPESGGVQVAISRTGTLVYAAGGSRTGERPLLWVDRSGAARPVADRQASFFWPRISRDGRRIAVTIDAALSKIWVLDVERGTFTRASSLTGDQDRVVWMPDGVHLTFAGDPAGTGAVHLFAGGSDGTGSATRLTDGPESCAPLSWSADSRRLLCRRIGALTGLDVSVYSADDRTLTPFLHGSSNEQSATFSPDGRWVAYSSDESGRTEVYVRPFPGPGPRSHVSTEGGTAPVWSRDGRELFFAKGDTLFVAAVRPGATFMSGPVRRLFSGPYSFAEAAAEVNYDVAPDGQRFVVPRSRVDVAPRQLELVLNWFEELERLAP
jgi:eukaryotic-like serine/threonine-protein kinase